MTAASPTSPLAPRVTRDRIALLIRIVAGVVFLAFSVGKFTRHAAEVSAFDDYGIPFPDASTYLVGVVEAVGGLALVLGAGTRLAAFALAGDMVGAIVTAGRIEGGPIHLGLAPALLVAMLVLLWSGPGAPSVDRAAPWRRGRRGATAIS